jgi:plasmid stability protein
VAQLVVRNLEEGVKARLQRRARRNGRSMEEEVRDILRSAANEPEPSTLGLGTQIASLFAGKGYNFEVSELGGYPVRPAKFDEE